MELLEFFPQSESKEEQKARLWQERENLEKEILIKIHEFKKVHYKIIDLEAELPKVPVPKKYFGLLPKLLKFI